jgi:hypothetical protein
VVADVEDYRTVETAGLIPFAPRDPVLLQTRAVLRATLASLSAQPGEVLHGIVEGPGVAKTDLDNALLYNVGGSVNAAARYGVALERRPPPSGSTATRYGYRLTSDPAVPAVDGELVVELAGVALSGAPRGWPEIWAAVRTSEALSIRGSAAVGELGLRLRVGAPRFAGAANGQFVKTIVDGVMTALHAHRDLTTVADVAARLATVTRLGGPQIAALLVDDERAALGVCRRLVVLRGPGVHCQPQDGRTARCGSASTAHPTPGSSAASSSAWAATDPGCAAQQHARPSSNPTRSTPMSLVQRETRRRGAIVGGTPPTIARPALTATLTAGLDCAARRATVREPIST